MRVSPYVAIVIGSKNMLMKVYEISAAKGIRTIDEIRYEYELGKEAYFTRKITFAQIEEICSVLVQGLTLSCSAIQNSVFLCIREYRC